MILFNAYKYLFYRIYDCQLRWFGKEDLPEWSAVVSVSVLNWVNIVGFLLALRTWTGLNIYNPLSAIRFQTALEYFSIILINAFIFIRNQRYKQIAEQFSNENSTQRRIKLILIFAYVIFSTLFLFIF